MDQNNYKALLIAGNLGRLGEGEFCILGDKRKSFINGPRFIDLPSDRKLEVDRKRITVDGKRQDFYVIRIGWICAMSPMNFETKKKNGSSPPPNQFSPNSTTSFVPSDRSCNCKCAC
jgi:hypothetical protein